MKPHRLFEAATAALLGLILGTLALGAGAAAQDRRTMPDSLVVRHVIQEGELLSRDDGVDGPGGLMQQFFGRRRSGDIARLRNYDGNFRVISRWCNWPDGVTHAEDCPEEYWRYSIRRSAGRIIEIPVSTIPTSRLDEVLAASSTLRRSVTRFSEASADPTADPTVEEPGDLDAEEGADVVPPADADRARVTELEAANRTLQETNERLAREAAERERVLRDENAALHTQLRELAAAAVMPLGWGIGGWSVAGLLLLACFALLFARSSGGGVQVVEIEKPFDPETDPRTKKIRDQREAYRTANGELELEKGAALTRAGTAEAERTAARNEKDAEQRDKNVAWDTLRKIGEAFGIPSGDGKVPTVMILARVRQASTFIQKVADWTQAMQPMEFALAGQAFDIKVEEAKRFEVLATRAVARVRVWGKTATARGRVLRERLNEISDLNTAFGTQWAEVTNAQLERVQEFERDIADLQGAHDGLVGRVKQLEDVLTGKDIEVPAWPQPVVAAAEAAPPAPEEELVVPGPALPDAPLEKPRRNDEKTEVVVGIEAFARETELQARSVETGNEDDELERAPTSVGFRPEDVDGAPGAEELPRERTVFGTIRGMQAVAGEAAADAPLLEIARERTHPGVGLGGDDDHAGPVAKVPVAIPRPTMTYGMQPGAAEQQAVAAEAATAIPKVPLPVIAPEGDDEADGDGTEDAAGDSETRIWARKEDRGNGSGGIDDTPVMCGCGQEIPGMQFADHARACPDTGKARLSHEPAPPPPKRPKRRGRGRS